MADRALLLLPELGLRVLASMCSIALFHHRMPSSWHTSAVCLVPKQNGKRGMGGVRPIALLTAGYRLATLVWHRRVLAWCKDRGVHVPGVQTGF